MFEKLNNFIELCVDLMLVFHIMKKLSLTAKYVLLDKIMLFL